MNTDCTVRRKAVTISLGEYMAVYRDEQKFMEYCRQCPNYARLWSCPPFDDCKDRIFRDYSQITIFASIITPDSNDIPLAQSSEIIIPERKRLERILLEMEYRYTGYAFAYAGSCLNCPQDTCTRPSGGRCRHPQLVRPSLEAYGFDIGKTTTTLLGIDLCWSTDGRIPPYLTLVTAIMHNQPSPEVIETYFLKTLSEDYTG